MANRDRTISQIELSFNVDKDISYTQDSLIKESDELAKGASKSKVVIKRAPMIPMFLYARSSEGGVDRVEEVLRDLKLFPIFGDQELANVSVNYFLYLEFFHMAIRIFIALLAFSGVIWIILAVYKLQYPKHSTQADIIGFGALVVLGGIVLRVVRLYEEKRIKDHDILTHYQWTEDLFSLRVKGISKTTTIQELTVFFNKLLFNTGIKGNVRYVVLLQDYHQYNKLSTEVKVITEKLAKPNINAKAKESLEIKKLQLERLLPQLKMKIINFQYFKGKAIIVFDSIEAKVAVQQYFNVCWLSRPLMWCFVGPFQKLYLNGERLKVTEATEPRGLIFENLHYPRSKRFIRKLLVYTVSMIIIIIGLNGLAGLQMQNISSGLESSDKLNVSEVLTNYGFIIGMFILGFVLEMAFRYTTSLLIYHNVSEQAIDFLNYSIYTSFMFYVVVQSFGVASIISTKQWINQIITLSVMYLIKKLPLRMIPILITSKFVNSLSMFSSGTLKRNILEKIQELYYEFDFTDGASCAIPIIFMGLGYMMTNPFIIIPIVIVILYIFAVIDKYVIIKCCGPLKIKSANYILKVFRAYKWDCFCFYWGGFISLVSYWELVDPKKKYRTTLYSFPVPIIIVLVLCYIKWPVPLYQETKKTFYEKNRNVQYSSVSKQFSSTYQIEDPVIKIIREIS